MIRQDCALHFFDECATQAEALAALLKVPAAPIERHSFPDGETLVRVTTGSRSAIVFLSLDRPNEKLVHLLLACDALRRNGAKQLILVAPYLCYMRQDAAFHEGEAISQKAVGGLLSSIVDAVITVDPHLHRTRHLSDVFPGIRSAALSSTPLLARHLTESGCPKESFLVGPDAESRQWVEAIAAPLGLSVLVGEKERRGDRDVRINIPGIEGIEGKPVILVDDVVSTGRTLTEAAALLKAARASSIVAMAVHLLDPGRLPSFRSAGVQAFVSTDSVASADKTIALAPILAPAVRELIS